MIKMKTTNQSVRACFLAKFYLLY